MNIFARYELLNSLCGRRAGPCAGRRFFFGFHACIELAEGYDPAKLIGGCSML